MKTLIGIIINICLLSMGSEGQSLAPTKIHFLNTMVGLNAEVKMTIGQKKPIVIKSRTWVIIQATGDSLCFVIDSKPFFVHFDPHKKYYFVIQGTAYSRPVVTEKSEQEFILTATIDSVKGPEEYVLSKLTN